MDRKARLLVGGMLAVALVGGGTGASVAAGGGDETETPITGLALASASAAALRHTGGGRVTGTEVGDEDGYYEVEVTRDDGGQVDVHLDRAFNVLGSKADRERSG
jgi:uncharacterized membrane protein YkoI